MKLLKPFSSTVARCAVLRWRLLRREAQAAIEFMLVLPMFLGFMFFLIDFGLLTFHYVSVANAVREGARFGATNCGDGFCTIPEVQTRVLDRSGGTLSVAGEVSVRWVDRGGNGGSSDRGDSVVVSVSHDYPFVFVPGATFPVLACGDMRLEQADRTVGLPGGTGC